jgi:hypothetical protein
VGQPTIRLPPNPDFNSLSPEEKDRIYQDLHNQVDSLVLQRKSFAHKALLWGDTGPALESGLAIQEFVIAFVCRFQVILLHGFNNFLTINDLRQILLDQYLRIGLEGGGQDPLTPISTKQLKKVHPGKAADLSNCLTYLWTLLLPITTGNTKIQQG